MQKILVVGLLAVSLIACEQTQDESSTVTFLTAETGTNTLPFSEAVKVDSTLILSGQIGIDPETNKLATGGFAAETKQTLANIEATLSRHNYSMSDVVKCTVILTDIKQFPEFNTIYKEAFSAPYPARTTYAVAALALNAKIEIECMAAK